MRWLAVALLLVASPVAADLSLVTDGVPGTWAPCVTALRAVLRVTYPEAGDEHYCELTSAPAGVTFFCHGACTDRSCHNDACERHDDELELTLEPRRVSPTGWTRTRDAFGSPVWERGYAEVRARLVTGGVTARLRRTVDACVAERAR